jgi:hypothetical protein
MTMAPGPEGTFRRASVWCGLLALALAVLPAWPASAQSRLEAHYVASLGALPIGTGVWIINVEDDHYTMTATGKAAGFLRMFGSGDGAAAVRGAIAGGHVVPSGYAISIHTRHHTDEVKMTFAGGSVREMSLVPPVTPNPRRVPITEAHKHGVIDPISAGLLPAGPDGVGPQACRRSAAVFDGRMRFDLSLSFKRVEHVHAEHGGYDGPAVLCGVSFTPVAGHERDKFAIRYLHENRNMEVAFAPIAGTHFLAMYRIAVPTLLGPAILQATKFVTTTRPLRTGAKSQ